MSWVQIDDNFPNHPKVLQAGPMAAWLYLCALCYCRKYHTSGFISVGALKELGGSRMVAEQLVSVGLWNVSGDGWNVAYRDGRIIFAKRSSNSTRRYLRHLLQQLIAVWGRACVYCGSEPTNLQVEHITPLARGGSDDFSNLTVACGTCNAKKRTKTAAEFGYPHIHPQGSKSR